ncbi:MULTISPECIES: wax ester/triacylglycerol synthase domain-containing protein [Streptomyces]|uniref:wax ester/triacylglycerol synthase domain-containing protein n=1 Tax=Streptomyces TaxID=1883 RepID=UPI0022491D6E|nr:wax ester/triacylglycerol synthase domain-containing protein [Streptomyces sp. JHD 1]MCX2968415.1 hypothetical protein [Streptomyces sp. JHD 1]
MTVSDPPAQRVPGARQRAHSVDRAFLRLQSRHPDLRWDGGGVAYLSGPPPSLAELRAHVGLRLGRLPMLRSRLEGAPGRSWWCPDPDFDVDRHVHEVVADGPAGWERALDTARNAPFAPGTYWGVWLVHGHAPDAYAVCYRFHHACQDGAAAALTFRVMLGAGEPSARPVPSPYRRFGRPRRIATALGLAVRTLGGALLTRGRGPTVPFVPSGDRALGRGRVPVDTLRRIGVARGGSAHDAHLAALAGALSAWSARTGVALPRMSALLPVDVRRPDEEQGWGNRVFALPLDLPVNVPAASATERTEGAPDGGAPLRRLERVTAVTGRMRTGRWRQAVQDLVRFMPDRPTEWCLRLAFSRRVTDLLATSMPLARKGDLGAATVTGTALLPPLAPGHLCAVGLSFFGDWAEVAFVTDRALPLAASLPGLWEQAVDELERAVDGTGDACAAPH